MKTKIYLSCGHIAYLEGAGAYIGHMLYCNKCLQDALISKYEGEAIWNPNYRPDRSELNDEEDI